MSKVRDSSYRSEQTTQFAVDAVRKKQRVPSCPRYRRRVAKGRPQVWPLPDQWGLREYAGRRIKSPNRVEQLSDAELMRIIMRSQETDYFRTAISETVLNPR